VFGVVVVLGGLTACSDDSGAGPEDATSCFEEAGYEVSDVAETHPDAEAAIAVRQPEGGGLDVLYDPQLVFLADSDAAADLVSARISDGADPIDTYVEGSVAVIFGEQSTEEAQTFVEDCLG
jgi:hypothetical protein